MARIRTIKPEFPQSETIGRLSRDARLLFILLWTFVDDHGRCRGNSRLLAANLFPYDADAIRHIDTWLAQLEHEGCIRRYIADENLYLDIPNWNKHQRIDNAGKSQIPEFRGDLPRTAANGGEPPLYLGPRTIGPRTEDICAVPDGTRTLESHFEEFWKIKPGRGSAANPRAPALNAYKRAVKAGADPTAINAAARVWASADTEAVGTKFTPTAAVWLNQRRFEDHQSRPEDAAKIIENEEFMKRRGYAWIENKWIKTEETNGQDQGAAGGIPARSETG